jgi:hypothetical protein
VVRLDLFLSSILENLNMPLYKRTKYRSKVKFMRVNLIQPVRCGYCHAPCVDDKSIYFPCRYLNNVILHAGLGLSYIPSDYANQEVKNF